MLLFGLNVLPMVTASVTYGYSLSYLWLQPLLPMVTASITYGYRHAPLRHRRRRAKPAALAILTRVEGQ